LFQKKYKHKHIFASSFIIQEKTTDSSNINEKDLYIDIPTAVNAGLENKDYRLRMIGR